MEDKPLVSVIIPTYNRANLICRAIESVINQTYKNLEIIVVDDGSTDNTKARIQPYIENIRYYYQENRGASAAQNKGIELATGDWISILASDDIWLPEKIELQLEALNIFGKEFGACFTDCRFLGSNLFDDTAFKRARLTSKLYFDKLNNPFDYILGHHLAFFVQSMLVKRCLVTGANGFNPKLIVLEDTDLIFRLSIKTRFCIVNKPLVIIDRTAETRGGRLSILIENRKDEAFLSMEAVYSYWLTISDVIEKQGLKNRIIECLKSCYYDWIITKIKRFIWHDIMPIAKKLNLIGEPYSRIFSNILKRGIRKLFRVHKIYID